ncbi:MAG TPA: hypothetical protein VMV86_00690 [Methanosarcinales archaeon]|nr:hypothetical protein [Methanosarcinales archaeon]
MITHEEVESAIESLRTDMGTTICSANDHYAGVIRKYIQQQEQRIEKQKEWYESRIHFHGVALDGADEDCRLTTDANNKLIQRIKELEKALAVYADKNNWKIIYTECGKRKFFNAGYTDVVENPEIIAQKALENK